MGRKENVERLKKAHATATAEANRAQGVLDSVMAQLKDQYGFDTLDEAREGYTKAVERSARLTAKFDEAYASYVKEFGDVLGIDSEDS